MALSTSDRAALLKDLGSLTDVIAALGDAEAVRATSLALIAVCTWIP
jgi:hypothetical protein